MPTPVGNAPEKRETVATEPDQPKQLALAPLEADITRFLMEEGVVIRGHDIARVVGLMAGQPVEWDLEAAR